MSQPSYKDSETCNVTSKFTDNQAVVNLDQHVIAVCSKTGELQVDVKSSRRKPSQLNTSVEEPTPPSTAQSVIFVCPKTGEVRQKIISHSDEGPFKDNNLNVNNTVVNLDQPVVAICPETGQVQSDAVFKSNGRDSSSSGDEEMESDSSSVTDNGSEYEQMNSEFEMTSKSCVELVTNVQASTSGLPPKMLCTTCGESFRCADMFQRHKCIDLTKSCCELCEFEYLTNKQYHIHLKKHIEPGSLKCPLCKKEFKKRPYLLVHLRSHSKHRLYECPHCDKEFIHYNQFKFHEHVHTGSKPYKCRVCDKMFSRLSDRKRHEDTHPRDALDSQVHRSKKRKRTTKRHKCKHCGETFNLLKNLHLHEHLHTRHEHQGEIQRTTKQHQCKQCGETFNLLKNLHLHEQLHTRHEHQEESQSTTKQHQCKQCGETFNLLENLQQHEQLHQLHKKIHAKREQFTCTYCARVFPSDNELKSHEASHANSTKPYNCTFCDKAFKQRSHLTDHERIHTGVKPFKCTICDKAFVQRSQLKYHENSHLGVKPFQCTQCGNTYSQHAHLKSHERTCINAGVKVYECRHCLKTFSRYGSLKAHEKMHKNIQNPNLTASLSQKLDFTVKQLTQEETLSRLTAHGHLQSKAKEIDSEGSKLTKEKNTSEKLHLDQEISEGEDLTEKQPQECDSSQELELPMGSPKNCKISELQQALPSSSHEPTYLEAKDIKKQKTEHSIVNDTSHKPNDYRTDKGIHDKEGGQEASRTDSFKEEPTHTDEKTLQRTDNPIRDQAEEIVSKTDDISSSTASLVTASQNEVELRLDNGFSQDNCMAHERTVQSIGGDPQNGNHMVHSSVKKRSSSECDQTSQEQEGAIAADNKLNEVNNFNQHTSVCDNTRSEQKRKRRRKSTPCRSTTRETHATRPYKCSFCTKAFIQRSHLRDHEYIHKGVKPFKCGFCDKTFTQNGNLKTHERIHTGNKPFACNRCDKAFIQRNHLREHVKIHFEPKRGTSYTNS